jgi:hypothetical protein
VRGRRIHCPPGTITEDALIAAAKFVSEYAMPAAERTYGDAACPEADRNLTTLARWMAKQRPNAVHVRDMQRNIRLPGLVTADAIHAACKALIEAGWLVMTARGGFSRNHGACTPSRCASCKYCRDKPGFDLRPFDRFDR